MERSAKRKNKWFQVVFYNDKLYYLLYYLYNISCCIYCFVCNIEYSLNNCLQHLLLWIFILYLKKI